MPEAPRFSVTIPAYNAEATLAETLDSVQAQTFKDFEVVICDDGSTDTTLALARGYALEDPRITVVSQENRGSGGAYNTAVRAASSQLIVMLSADDLLLPGHLREMDRFISEHPEAGICTCDGYYQYEDGTRERANSNARWSDPSGATLSDLMVACFYGIGAVYRKEVFDKVGGFREDIYAEDYPFWLMALATGFTHRHLDVPLSVHRRNSEQKSADALRVRRADVAAIQHVIDSGLLDEKQHAVATAQQARLRRGIRMRASLTWLLGQQRAERLIARTRTRRMARQSAAAKRSAEGGR